MITQTDVVHADRGVDVLALRWCVSRNSAAFVALPPIPPRLQLDCTGAGPSSNLLLARAAPSPLAQRGRRAGGDAGGGAGVLGAPDQRLGAG